MGRVGPMFKNLLSIFDPQKFIDVEEIPLISSMPQSDDAWIGMKHDPSLLIPPDPRHELGAEAHSTGLPVVVDGKATLPTDYLSDEDCPTEEDVLKCRRVADKIPFRVYTIAFVELCERFSYYGTQILCKL